MQSEKLLSQGYKAELLVLTERFFSGCCMHMLERAHAHTQIHTHYIHTYIMLKDINRISSGEILMVLHTKMETCSRETCRRQKAHGTVTNAC